jgi:hypothetical protein
MALSCDPTMTKRAQYKPWLGLSAENFKDTLTTGPSQGENRPAAACQLRRPARSQSRIRGINPVIFSRNPRGAAPITNCIHGDTITADTVVPALVQI